MNTIAVIGSGITGVTTAYALAKRGYHVTVFDRHRYPAMETSYANGGQLSASNGEVWNSFATMLKGIKWMMQPHAPLLLNPSPSWHKYSWLTEFAMAIRGYRQNTLDTVRLAIESRKQLLRIADEEKIAFDLEKRGILHIYHDERSFAAAGKVNSLLQEGGLERFAVRANEIQSIEPALACKYFGGYFTPGDMSGDIHKFTRQLAVACSRRGVIFVHNATVAGVSTLENSIRIEWVDEPSLGERAAYDQVFDGVVVCAGVESRKIAAQFGDRLNVYPVKGYSITVHLEDDESEKAAPWVSLLDEDAKIVTSRLGKDRFRVAGTAEFNGINKDIRADRTEPLVRWVRKNFPLVQTSKIVPWAGLRPMMPNMMPVVRKGRRAGVFYNTGHGHLGWTLSAATAELTAELIAKAPRT